MRKLASELELRGAPMAGGEGHWDRSQVRNILTNPAYCGRGRTGRYVYNWEKARDSETGHVREVKRRYDRLNDPTAWRDNTYPIPESVVPPIISPDVWDRPQEVLVAAAVLRNRGGPRRTDALANSTLLDGGYIYCAECGRKMVRFWQARESKPYYRCHPGGTVPHGRHATHSAAAAKVDMMVLGSLARALTDPEELLLIADAAETERSKAEAAFELAEAQDAATVKRLDALAAEQDHVTIALKALAQVPGMDTEVARLRARMTTLEAERQDLLSIREDAYSQRTEARATILRSLFTIRDWMFQEDGSIEEIVGSDRLDIGQRMTTAQAAAFLGVPEGSDLGVPVREGEPYTYQTDDGGWEEDAEADTVLTSDVLLARLQQLPRDRVRALLRAQNVRVRVKPPKPRVEQEQYQRTPMEDRVEIVIHDSLVLHPRALGVDAESLLKIS